MRARPVAPALRLPGSDRTRATARRLDARTAAGLVALALAALLSGPGVRVVRAEDAPPPVAAEPEAGAPMCSAAAPPDLVPAQLGQLMEQARRDALAAGPGVPGDEEAVVLNNRGFNYGPAPGVDPTLPGVETRLER